MPIYVKDSGVWKESLTPYVKAGSDWVLLRQGYVKDGGTWKRFYGVDDSAVQTTTYDTAGSYSYTVPAGVTEIQVTATGGGGSGSVIYYDGGAYGRIDGDNGGNTTVSPASSGWSLTANGGYGGHKGDGRGTISVSGATSTTTSQTGGNNSGETGGTSFWGTGSAGSEDFVRSDTPTYGAGSGGGFNDGSTTQGGDAGGTFVGTFAVTPGEVISITVGAGGAAKTINYTRGPDHGSYSGAGGSGRVIIKVAASTTDTYASAGTYSYTVPSGVTSLSVTAYGAGGGSGACNNNGDAWVGSGGGAGGKDVDTIAVTPGETLTVEVGLRGYGASYRFNSNYSYNPNNSTLGTGLAGGTTRVKRGSTVLLEATGGGAGAQFAYGGAGGTPQVAGTAHPDGQGGNGSGGRGASPGYIGYGYTGAITGGTNGSGTPPSGNSSNRGTGYGNGGGQPGLSVGIDGQDGAVLITYETY